MKQRYHQLPHTAADIVEVNSTEMGKIGFNH